MVSGTAARGSVVGTAFVQQSIIGFVANRVQGWMKLVLNTGIVSKVGQGTAPAVTTAAALIGTPTTTIATAYTPSVDTGTVPFTRTQQFTLDGTNIGGATGATYTPVSGDATHTLAVVENISNIYGSTTSTSSGVVVVVLSGASSITVTWQLPTLDATGAPIGTITGQTVYYDTVSRGPLGGYASSSAVGDGTSTSKVITSLSSGVVYYFAVTATTAVGEGSYSAEVSATAP
jgi:hypothetical protein